MANDMLKAASEARKFVKSLEALAAVGPLLEEFGRLDQIRAETQREIDAARAEIAKLKEDQAAIARANAEAREKAQAAAARVIGEAEKAAAAINSNVQTFNDELSAENDVLQARLDDASAAAFALSACDGNPGGLSTTAYAAST